MSNVPREKIALVVFVGLIAVSLFGLVGYLAVGHSWNVAASNIDDATGQMDGYTAIVFKGTVDPAVLETKAENKKNDASASSGSKASEDAARDVESGLSGLEDPYGLGGTGSDAGASGSPADSGHDSEPGASGSSAESGHDSDAAASGLPADTEQGAETAPGSTGSASSTTKRKPPIAIEDVEQSYLDKNATVFSIDAENLERYREGTILKKGSDRFGVFSVTPKMTKRMIEAQVAYFQTYNVDFIVVLTPDKEIVEEAEGIDIVISTQDEGLFVMGETINGTFYVNAPEIGSVGVILISPSNVVSAKAVHPS
ncbi:alcohol dehydrogenase [Raoultibacter phocaeensis]|uniref:alcohol dehydrogenase n=1 Tax=Raoultibacter phocaeensis TaxID=2479841 RepID=UPI0011188595|nr:alcohol dehydrogenase [Raoultibacter phocaeensis]